MQPIMQPAVRRKVHRALVHVAGALALAACGDATGTDGDPPPLAAAQPAYAIYSGDSAEAWRASDLSRVPPPPRLAGIGTIVLDPTLSYAVATWGESRVAFGVPARWSAWRPADDAAPRRTEVSDLRRSDSGSPPLDALLRPVHVGTDGRAYATSFSSAGGTLAVVDLATLRVVRRVGRGSIFALWQPAGTTRAEVLAFDEIVRTSLYGNGILRRFDLVSGAVIDSIVFAFAGTTGERTNAPFVPRRIVVDRARASVLLLGERSAYVCEPLERRCRGMLASFVSGVVDEVTGEWHLVASSRREVVRWDAAFTTALESTPVTLDMRGFVTDLRFADAGRAYDLAVSFAPAVDSLLFGVLRVERGTGRTLAERRGRTVSSDAGGGVVPWIAP
jgi:hypothetical protein